MKRNGCDCPLHYLQILSWIIFAFIISSFYIFTAQLIKYDSIIIQFVYGLLSFVLMILTLIASLKDPSDPYLKKELEKKRKCKENRQTYVLEILKNLEFCVICCSNIESSSKHCSVCNKCVNDFDHHCNWINNCIGKENYKDFFFLIVSVIFNLGYSVVFNILTVSYLYNNDDEEKKKLKEKAYLWIELDIVRVIIIVIVVIEFVLIIIISYLLAIHIFFLFNNTTTYEYITNKGNINNNVEDNDKSDTKINIKSRFKTEKKSKRNKIEVEDLLKRLNNLERKIEIVDNEQKILIYNTEYHENIFKPIIEDIYCKTNQVQVKRSSKKVLNRSSFLKTNFNNLGSNIQSLKM